MKTIIFHGKPKLPNNVRVSWKLSAMIRNSFDMVVLLKVDENETTVNINVDVN